MSYYDKYLKYKKKYLALQFAGSAIIDPSERRKNKKNEIMQKAKEIIQKKLDEKKKYNINDKIFINCQNKEYYDDIDILKTIEIIKSNFLNGKYYYSTSLPKLKIIFDYYEIIYSDLKEKIESIRNYKSTKYDNIYHPEECEIIDKTILIDIGRISYKVGNNIFIDMTDDEIEYSFLSTIKYFIKTNDNKFMVIDDENEMFLSIEGINQGKKLVEERELAEERRLADERKLADERRLADEIKLADERRLADKRRLAEERKLEDEGKRKNIIKEPYFTFSQQNIGRKASLTNSNFYSIDILIYDHNNFDPDKSIGFVHLYYDRNNLSINWTLDNNVKNNLYKSTYNMRILTEIVNLLKNSYPDIVNKRLL
jgi:hypothetical protein